MSFSMIVRGQIYHGPMMRTIYGDWTGSYGDAAGTYQAAGNVLRADFVKQDPLDNTNQIRARTEVSQSGFISTITIENQDNVTGGHFQIDLLGN